MAGQRIEIDPSSEEPSLLSGVREYWTAQRGGRDMPGRRDINPAELKPHLPYVLLVDVFDGGADFRYRLVGSRLHPYFSGNPTGRSMREVLAPFGHDTVERTIAVYTDVVKRRAPMRIRGPGALFSQNAKQFDALLAPLSDNGADVNMIFGTFLFEWNKTMGVPQFASIRGEEAAMEKALRS